MQRFKKIFELILRYKVRNFVPNWAQIAHLHHKGNFGGNSIHIFLVEL